VEANDAAEDFLKYFAVNNTVLYNMSEANGAVVSVPGGGSLGELPLGELLRTCVDVWRMLSRCFTRRGVNAALHPILLTEAEYILGAHDIG
jgi:hypothetical protein